MVRLRHATQAIGDNNPDRQVGVEAWNADHAFTGTANTSLGFDSTGAAISLSGPLSVEMFGATGTGSETLYSTSYVTDIAASPITISQQTVDGLAINAALRILRTAGGGTLIFPKGTFTTYGYLEKIDFPLRIVGAGRGVTIIRNCTTSPWSNGYGIFCVEPASLSEVSFSDLTLDGYGTSRTLVAAERRAYPLSVYGLPKLTLHNVEFRNSPIDTFMTAYTNGDNGTYVQATNCFFSNSYRNTISLVGGWNQQYTNCIIEKGGKVQGGTSPKACLDIEPNSSATAFTIKNLTFTNCIFREAINGLVYGTWCGQVRFNACRFEAFGSSGTGVAGANLPYLAYIRGGEFTYNGCSFQSTDGSYMGAFVFANDVTTGDYAATQFVELNTCWFSGAGILGYGPKLIINNLVARDSLVPIFHGGNNTQNVVINGMHLVNVFDGIGIGLTASWGFNIDFEGYANVSNVDVRFSTGTMVTAIGTALAAKTQIYGIQLHASATGKARLANIHSSGWFQQCPTYLGKTLSTTNFRDYRQGTTPPADTAGSDTNASVYFYRNMTQYGNAA